MAFIYIIILLTVCIYLFHFLFFWIFPSTDSHFYWLFANFLRTGNYSAPHPYYYTQPSTMEPPLYSVFLFFADNFTRADLVVHLVQVLAILASSIIIYKIFRHYYSENLAILGAELFLLVPAHFIYISNLVAEPLAVFYITLYLFILHKIINLKNDNSWVLLLPYSAVISLQRYNLLFFFFLSVFLFWKSKKKRRSGYVGFITGLAILTSWILINHKLNGSWGISNAEGKHLYNRILHFNRILPVYNHPTFDKFRKFAGERDDYFKPWWFYEEALIKSTGSETKASRVMQEFALAAFFSNPVKYIFDTPGFFLFAHGENPTFHDPLYLYNSHLKDQAGNMSRNCQGMGNISFCKPIIKVQYNFEIWDRMVRLIDYFYFYIVKYINYFILLPSVFYSIVQKDRFFKIIGVLYFMSILFFVLTEAPLPRYTYIFTPLTVMLIMFTILDLSRKLVRREKID